MPTPVASSRRRLKPAASGALHQRVGTVAGLERDGVEERVVPQRVAAPPRRIGQQPRLQVHPPRRCAQPLRPVPHGIHAGHHRQQHLRGADVARRLLAADVLLARLQRQAHRRAARRHPGSRRPAGPACSRLNASRWRRTPHAARRSPSARRSAAPSRRTTSAPISPGGVSSARPAGRRQTIASAPASCAAAISGVQVAHRAGRAGILQHHGERLRGADRRGDVAGRDIDQREAERAGAGRQHGAGLRMQVGGDRDRVALWPCCAACAMATASAAAVASSSSEALAIGMPVRSQTIVWKFSSASSRPCAISA